MAEKTIRTRFQLRRDIEDNFTNVILANGEPGYATDTRVFKIGDGETVWQNLESIKMNFVGDTTQTSDEKTGITAYVTSVVTFQTEKTPISDLAVSGSSIDTVPEYSYEVKGEQLTLGSREIKRDLIDLTATGSYEELKYIDEPDIMVFEKPHHHTITPEGKIK